jgi:hypothetical protein
MNESDLVSPDTNWERVAVIQRLCKRKGIVSDKEIPYEVFGVKDSTEFSNLISTALWLMPRWPANFAIRNALGFGIEGTQKRVPDQLTGRRVELAAHLNVSVKTIARLEISGAVILDDYIRRLTDSSEIDWLIRSIFSSLGWIHRRAVQLRLDPLVTDQAADAVYLLTAELTRREEFEKAERCDV